MPKVVSSLLLAGALIVGIACGTSPTHTGGTAAIVIAQTGQSVKQAVDSLPPNGGTVILGVGAGTAGTAQENSLPSHT